MNKKNSIEDCTRLIILPFFQYTIYIRNKITGSSYLIRFKCGKKIVILSRHPRFVHFPRLPEQKESLAKFASFIRNLSLLKQMPRVLRRIGRYFLRIQKHTDKDCKICYC